MTIHEWLSSSTIALKKVNIASARLDCIIILEYSLKRDRAWLLANLGHDLSRQQISNLNNLLNERLRHRPIAYITKTIEFYGRSFLLKPRVLVPRPETETMITLLKTTLDKDVSLNKATTKINLLDVGTGCGALGITAKLEVANCDVDLSDVSVIALKNAKINVDKFTLNIRVIESNLLKETANNYHVILANLPYLPDDFSINLAAAHEPKRALFGGKDGLSIYRKMFKQISYLNIKPLYILCESLPNQHPVLANIASLYNYSLKEEEDFIQVYTSVY